MSGIFRENMQIVILLSSIALISATQVDPPPRSVNVALETSFLFDPKDLNDNKSLVNHIRRFLDKLFTILEPQTEEKVFRTETKLHKSEERRLGDFIEIMKNIGQNVLNMTSTKIKEALDTIHGEVKNITEKQHQQVLQILPTRSQNVFKDLLDTWMHSSPDDIKIFINSTVRENKPLLQTFARRMNSYYNANDVRKLNKILKKFKRYIDKNKDISKIVKKILHNSIFKKYDNLNDSAKAAVMGDLRMLSEFLIEKNSVTDKNDSVLSRRHSPNHEFVDVPEFPDDITYTALRRSIDKKVRNAREKNEVKENVNNRGVVGNMELFVESPQSS